MTDHTAHVVAVRPRPAEVAGSASASDAVARIRGDPDCSGVAGDRRRLAALGGNHENRSAPAQSPRGRRTPGAALAPRGRRGRRIERRPTQRQQRTQRHASKR